MKIWRVIDIIQEATTFLKNKGIEDPRLNAERLLASTLKLSRVDLYLQFEKPLSETEREIYKGLLKRRAQHEPLQYITGETEFMSLTFRVGPNILIPRPETEILVEKVIDLVKDQSFHILDIGTGSGCIAVSAAHYCPEAEITALDISQPVLESARGNARLNHVEDRIRFKQVDILSFDPDKEIFDLIVSNPPYISENEWQNLPPEIRKHEPKTALSDGKDGLKFYRKIAESAVQMLLPGGTIILEIGDTQLEPVRQILTNHTFGDIQITHDLNGIPRVIQGKKS